MFEAEQPRQFSCRREFRRVRQIDKERLRRLLEDIPHEALEEFANFAEAGVRVRNQPDLVDATNCHERDQRQERGGPVIGDDEIFNRAARRVEEVFGVAVAGAVEVEQRGRLGPSVDLAQDGAVYVSGVIHTPDVIS